MVFDVSVREERESGFPLTPPAPREERYLEASSTEIVVVPLKQRSRCYVDIWKILIF